MWYLMNWKWYTGLSLLTLASGVVTGYALSKWETAYAEARDAGAVM